MPRNCPFCDMYTIDDNICAHCGEKLPNNNVEVVAEAKKSKSYQNSGLGFFSKFVIFLVSVLVLFVGYKLFFGSNDVPLYMNEGPIYLSDKIEPGKINIFDFYSDFCGPCKQISPYLKKLQEKRPDLNIVQIDINRKDIRGIDWNSPIVKQFKIKSIPFFLIIDSKGKILKKEKAAYKYVIKMIQDSGV